MKLIYQHIIILLFLCIPTLAITQVLDIENYTTSEYLGRSNFYGFTQDENLNLYFSSNEGILSFNGVSFSEIKITPEIDSNPVGQLIYFNNSIYFSTAKGVFKFNLNSDSLHKILDTPAKEFLLSKNNLFFISGKSIYQLTAKQISASSIFTDDNYNLSCFFINEKIIVAGTPNGLRIIENGELKYSIGSFINTKAIEAENDSSLLVLSDDALFTISLNDSIKASKISRISVFNKEKDSNLFQSQIGNTYISTSSGKLYQYDPVFDEDNLITINEKNGLDKFPINYIDNDVELNLWVLGENGLSKISINQPITIIQEKNIENAYSNENSVLIIKKDQFQIYDFNLRPSTFRIQERIQESSAIFVNDEWWITINSKYVYKVKRNTIKREVCSSDLKFIHSFDQNKFLAINREGKLQLYNLQGEVINKLDELDLNPYFLVGHKQHYIISNNEVYIFNSNGLSSTQIKVANDIPLNTLRASNLGLWSFHSNSLVLHNSDGSVKSFNHLWENQFNHRQIYNVFEDSQSNLWVSLNTHLAKINFVKEDNAISVNEATLYGNEDHVKNSYFKNAIELENQQIWFTSNKVITIYNPLLDNPHLVAPGVFISSAYAINYDEFNDPIDTLQLNDSINRISNKHEIIIDPGIVSFYKKHKSKIQYRIKTADNVWNNLPFGEKIRLRNLVDGNNGIEIRAINPNGITSKDTITYTLNVKPPIWKRNWFYIGALLSVVLLGLVGYKSINNFKDNKTKELHEKLDEKLGDLERRTHLQILKSERLKQLNELITSQKGELEKKNKQIESQKYELSLTNDQIKKQKDLLEDTGNKLKASINYAQRIQNALMSTEVEVKKAIDDSFIYFLPRDVVSGDFYWFNKAKNDKGEELLILAAVDCTGHGVPGAIVSVVGINLLNNITNLKKIYDPGQILTELNSDIIHNLRQNETQVNDGMDMSLVTINYQAKTIEFAGAKNPLMYVEDGELVRIRGDKNAIGGQQRGEERAFQTHTINCSDGKNRTFFLFSDGYQDQFGGEKGFKFLTSNFKQLLLQISNLPVLEQKTILHERLDEWKGEYSQTDDVLVIGFKF